MNKTSFNLTPCIAALPIVALIFMLFSGCAGTQSDYSPSASGMAGKYRKFGLNLGIGEIKLEGNYSSKIHNIIAELTPISQEIWIKSSKVIEAFQVGAISSDVAGRCFQVITGVSEVKESTERVINNPKAPTADKINALNRYKETLEETTKEINKIFQTDDTPKKLIYDFNFNKRYWEYWTEGGARAGFQFYKSKVSASIIESTGAPHHIQLFQYRLNLVEDRRYALRLLVSSNKNGELISKFHKPSPNWASYQSPDESYYQLNPGINAIEATFLASKSTEISRLTLYLGQLDRGTEIIIHKCQLYEILE